jgi:hypothetical protein
MWWAVARQDRATQRCMTDLPSALDEAVVKIDFLS